MISKKRLEKARERIKWLLEQGLFSDPTRKAQQDMLAATEEPTDEELVEEALRWRDATKPGAAPTTWLDAYAAGARREGRQ
jgi:hypothetical protein